MGQAEQNARARQAEQEAIGRALDRALWAPRTERALKRALLAPGPEQALGWTAWAPGTERQAQNCCGQESTWHQQQKTSHMLNTRRLLVASPGIIT